jgi:hypothetical protein
LLAPLSTPALAACTGSARAGNTGAFGNWVQLVCPLPRAFGGKTAGYVSIFYAHLAEVRFGESWTAAQHGQVVGATGKTGNAEGATVEPHLHLEIIVAESERAAREESHSGLIQSSNWAVARFLARLQRGCLTPRQFTPRAGHLQRARRVDPFIVLGCLVTNKPPLTAPSSGVRAAGVKWSERYRASGFDVDAGARALEAHTAPFVVTRDYFVGRWAGELAKPRASATLEVSGNGRFVADVAPRLEPPCTFTGELGLRGSTLELHAVRGACAAPTGPVGAQTLIDATPDEFVIADTELADAVSRRADGGLDGPVWVFRRSARLNAGL